MSLALTFLLAGWATGCSSSQPPAQPDRGQDFSGPYAERFREIYAKTTDPELRALLEDGEITEAESQVVVERLRSCLAEQGITLRTHDENGTHATITQEGLTPAEASDRAEECSEQSGESTVLLLYFSMKRDPQNQIAPATIVECLIRAGVVPEDFTTEEYASSGIDTYHPSETLYEPAGAEVLERVTACEADPLGTRVR